MAGNKFSVYNALLGKDLSEHPLKFLLPEDSEMGWPARRNPKRPLNHLELLIKKEDISSRLNLHNTITEPAIFNENYILLEKHQKGEITTGNAHTVTAILQQNRQQLIFPLNLSKR